MSVINLCLMLLRPGGRYLDISTYSLTKLRESQRSGRNYSQTFQKLLKFGFHVPAEVKKYAGRLA
jgi:hypothetical protein